MSEIKYINDTSLYNVKFAAEDHDADLITFVREAKDMSMFNLIKKYGINEIIQQGIKMAYDIEYNSMIRSKCAYKKYKILRETLGNVGPKGSLQRYKALTRALRDFGTNLKNNTSYDVLSCNEIVGLILESVVEEKLINEAMQCQELLVKYSKDKSQIQGVKQLILSLVCRMENLVRKKENTFNFYTKRVRSRYWDLQYELDKQRLIDKKRS